MPYVNILCTCPNCESGNMIEAKYSWVCNECDFKLYKQQYGRSMSHEELETLANTGATGVLADFVSKEKGTKYEGILSLQRDEVTDQMRVLMTFPERRTVACPCCSGILKEKNKLYECECGFKLWKIISHKTLTESQVKDLLEKGRTKEIKGFISKAGKAFSAKLAIDTEAKQVVFEFNNKGNVK